jgi:hypothetical protein
MFAGLAIAQQEGFHRPDIGIGRRFDPAFKFTRRETNRGNAFPLEARFIAANDGFPFIDNQDHLGPRFAVASFFAVAPGDLDIDIGIVVNSALIQQ